jgi:hypothetical protein
MKYDFILINITDAIRLLRNDVPEKRLINAFNGAMKYFGKKRNTCEEVWKALMK